nr:MAG TPA: hypothetical protein [Bacteriophage sp.]
MCVRVYYHACSVAGSAPGSPKSITSVRIGASVFYTGRK